MSCYEAKRRQIVRDAVALSLTAYTSLFSRRAQANALRTGQTAPPAVLTTTLDGERIATQSLLGQIVILTFWATWCSPCRAELPLLSDYAAQYAAKGLAVLGFSLDGAEQTIAVRKVAKSLSFPVGLLSPDSAPGYGRIWRIPVNFTIARDGPLVDNGWNDQRPVWTSERLERIVSPLLHSPP